jgi:hypothetical protein
VTTIGPMADQAAAQQPQAGSGGGTGSSNVPQRKECNIPGKACWVLWRTNFEIDQHYTPIKAIGKGAYGVVCRWGRRQCRARSGAVLRSARRTVPFCRAARCGAVGASRRQSAVPGGQRQRLLHTHAAIRGWQALCLQQRPGTRRRPVHPISSPQQHSKTASPPSSLHPPSSTPPTIADSQRQKPRDQREGGHQEDRQRV